MNTQLTDWRGTPITEGSLIVYPAGKFRGGNAMRQGRVVRIFDIHKRKYEKIDPKLPRWYRDETGEEMINMRIVKVPVPGLRVRIEEPFNPEWTAEEVTISKLETVTVIPE